ncbi:MAG: methionyl-tRNA formyltransferase [Flavobacterium sp.]|nr:methionyl-tRNA formyltransferase [Pedobacter sp.]
MGTPDFAVASLDAILKAGFNVVAVITAPDKPAGRGQKVNESAVKLFSREKDLNILQPTKLKDPFFLQELKSLNADLQVVVAFRMLPEVVWDMPPMGTINLHGSLLPQYRGAAPINWAIINGEKKTGVTTFFLKQEIDTGDILFSDQIAIANEDTAGDVHDKLMNLGAELLVKTITAIESGRHKETAQNLLTTSELRHAPKIFKENCLINWQNPVKEIYNLVRGLSPYPGAYTTLNNKILKIFKAEMQESAMDAKPGEHQTDGKTFLKFYGDNGFILIKDLQLEGKKRMKVEEFLKGFKFLEH